MTIEQTPSLPWVNDKLIKEYLTILSVNTDYTAYSIDDDYNVIAGIGTIKNNGSYNYHNNYDDSEDTLFFTYVTEYKHSISSQKWWTLNKAQAEELCLKEKAKFIELLNKTIKQLS